MKFPLVRELAVDGIPVTVTWRVLKFSSQGYYKWLKSLYKTELIYRKGPWCNVEHVEWETLKYVDWFNNRRILESLDYVPPVEFEARYYDSNESESLAALEMI